MQLNEGAVAGQRGVVPTRLGGDIATEPLRRFETSRLVLGGELHLGRAQPRQGAPVHIHVDGMRTQFHPVTHLLDATALGVPPQCLGLVQPDGNLDLGAAQSPSAFTVTTAMASVLAQGKGVLPAGVREKYREKFGWSGRPQGRRATSMCT